MGTAAGCIAAAEGFLGLALLRADMTLGLIPVRVAPVWIGARCAGGGVGGGAGACCSGGAWSGSGGGRCKCLNLLKLGIRLGSSSVGTTVGGLVGERSGLIGGVRLLPWSTTGNALGTPELPELRAAQQLANLYSSAQVAKPRFALIERMMPRSRGLARLLVYCW
jgi:hypothetical protein